MFYIIEIEYIKEVKINKFKTLKQAKKFKQNFKSTSDIPQNWHRLFTTEILEAPKGFRLKNAATKYQERELRQYCEVVK